ncbi:MAG TPA: hypothetical protein VMB04_15405 [Mycobacterium sp.]|nr:hypothetical protein [Mycobacterium sp.]
MKGVTANEGNLCFRAADSVVDAQHQRSPFVKGDAVLADAAIDRRMSIVKDAPQQRCSA